MVKSVIEKIEKEREKQQSQLNRVPIVKIEFKRLEFGNEFGYVVYKDTL